MKCFKSLEGHSFYTSGFVSKPVAKEVNAELVIVLSKVSEVMFVCCAVRLDA